MSVPAHAVATPAAAARGDPAAADFIAAFRCRLGDNRARRAAGRRPVLDADEPTGLLSD